MSDVNLKGHIAWNFKPLYGTDSNGNQSRLHGPFSASYYFEEACRTCESDAVPGTKAVCFGGFSDGTKVLANCTAYPVYIVWLNIDEEHRKTAKAVRLAGLIPVIEGTPERKMQILHLCLAHILGGFNGLNEVSKSRLCPDRRFRSTRIFLAFWAADLVEHWSLRCMVQQNCIMCQCPKADQGLLDTDYPLYESKVEEARYEGDCPSQGHSS